MSKRHQEENTLSNKEKVKIIEFIKPLKQINYEFVYHKEFPERRFLEKAGGEQVHTTCTFMNLKENTGIISFCLEIT